MKEIKGICPIIAVPFTAGGEVDLESFQTLTHHLMGTGVPAVTLFGLVSEFYKLTDAEREELMQLFLKEAQAHFEVASIISITDHSWELAVGRARHAEAMGADALNVLPPFFLGPSEQAVIEHISRVLEAVQIPVIVQYAPVQTGLRFAPETFVRLATAHPNLQFVKVEAQPPGRSVGELLALSQRGLKSLVGYAGVQMPDALERGAVGIQPGCSFVEIYLEIYRQFCGGNLEEMRALHARLLPYIGYWMQQVELLIQVEKTILHRRGIIASEYCRAPAYKLDAIEMDMIDAFLGEFSTLLSGLER